MGAWDPGPFDNDTALDWVYDLESADGLDFLAEAFDAVPRDADEYLDSDEACAALAAGEVLAALVGQPMLGELPKEIQNWVIGKPVPDARLIKRAIRAIKRVRKNSELQELWEETSYFEKWCGTVDDLLKRLQSALPAE